MDFDCFTGNRSSIPTHSDSFGKWINLRPGQPKLCEECWVVSSRCWQDINLNSAYDCENGLLSLLQFNHMEKFNYSFLDEWEKVYCSCSIPLDFVISSSKIFLFTTPCGGVFIGILLTSTRGDFIGDFGGDWHFLGDLYGLAAFSSAGFK